MDVSLENRHTITPTSKDFGNRVDTFLAQSKDFKDIIGRELSRTHIARGIRDGGAFLGSSPAKPHTKISKDALLIILPDKFTQAEETLTPEPDLPIIVIKETPNFIIINKPAGIQVHPSSAQESGTVVHWSIAHYPEIATIGDPARPGIVHRLDRDTSGLLIIARTKKSFTALKKRFKERAVHKQYLAIVYGIPKAKEGVIATPIARSTRGDRQSAAIPGRRVKGIVRPAETAYRLIKTFNNTALIEVEPKTGRTHQIRVHLASIGHPVLGDTLYASRASRAVIPSPKRQLLHAANLSFELFGQEYSFTAPLPSDFSDWQELFTKQQ
ncbi:MAG: RluA family pseudouridine synthase [Candidatus Moraniibacteriota bacterium]|nr:MAG: RluA family pseudouridine synthase [Candidatus Moranbacteria bacterium]